MTITQPYESSVIDWGVIDWMVVDEDYTSSSQSYITPKAVPVEIYSSAMVYLGILDDYTQFKFEENWYEVDSWSLTVNRYRINASQLVVGGFIRYTNNGYSHIGIIERIEKPLALTGKASEQWVVSGHGIEAVLSYRLATYVTGSGTGFHTVSAVSGTDAMRQYVDYNCIDSSKCGATRVITGLTLDATPTADSTVVSYSARFQPLTDILYDICTATELSYELTWSGSGLNFTFDVRAGTDKSSTVKISPEFDNVEWFKYLLTNAELKNTAYVGGVGLAQARDVDIVYDTTEPEYWTRREVFVEASDCLNTAAMLSRGTSTLATMGVQMVLEVGYLESNTFLYGTDFKIGDIVTVVFPDVVTTTGQIVSVTEDFSAKGIKTTLGIGRAYPNLTSVMKDDRKKTSAQVRR
jgi:hypothetical protein